MKFPNPIFFTLAMFRAARALFSGRNPLASAATVDFRLSQCATCLEFNPVLRQCNQCGCFADLKAQLKTEKCPLNRWGRIALTKRRVNACLSKVCPTIN